MNAAPASEERDPWSVRDLDILAENIAMARKFGLEEIEAGADPGKVFSLMLSHIEGFVRGTQAMVVPSHMIPPDELVEAVALGRELAERYGWR